MLKGKAETDFCMSGFGRDTGRIEASKRGGEGQRAWPAREGLQDQLLGVLGIVPIHRAVQALLGQRGFEWFAAIRAERNRGRPPFMLHP